MYTASSQLKRLDCIEEQYFPACQQKLQGISRMNESCCIEYLWVAFTGGIQLFFRRSGELRVWRGIDGVRLCLML